MSGAAEMTGVFNRDDYEIKAEIGIGHFGTVHRAWWSSRGIEVALKHVRAEGADGGVKIKAENRGAELQQRFSSRYRNPNRRSVRCRSHTSESNGDSSVRAVMRRGTFPAGSR